MTATITPAPQPARMAQTPLPDYLTRPMYDYTSHYPLITGEDGIGYVSHIRIMPSDLGPRTRELIRITAGRGHMLTGPVLIGDRSDTLIDTTAARNMAAELIAVADAIDGRRFR